MTKQQALDYCANNGYRYRPEFSLTRNAEIAATEGRMGVAEILRSVKDERARTILPRLRQMD